MKKFLPLALLVSAAAVTSLLQAAGDVTSRSFFSLRPHFQSGTFEMSSLFRNDRMDSRDCGYGSAFELVVLGGRSVCADDLARYFLPWGKTKLVVAEGAATGVTPIIGLGRDVDARHLNIETVNNTFKSTLSFCPRHTFFGVALDWKQALCQRDDGTQWLYFELSAPLIHVSNKMGITEVVEDDGGGVAGYTGLDGAPRVGTALEAFRQCNWQYGKILPCSSSKRCGSCCINGSCDSCCDSGSCGSSSCTSCSSCSSGCSDGCCDTSCKCEPYKRTRIADLELKLGANFTNTGCCRLDSYVGAILPTGNKPLGQYVFEAVVGNNKHFGVMYGGNMELGLYKCNDHSFRFIVDHNTRYLFPNNQRRSFDLRDKSWSRYMAMYENKDAAQAFATAENARGGTSGINIMTPCVRVHPRFSMSVNAALRYDHCCFNGEVGYGLFSRQAEKVCPCIKEGPALMASGGDGYTNPFRTLNATAGNSDIAVASYRPFEPDDVDPNTGSHPAMLSYTVYGTLGYSWKNCCYPTFVGLGGSYDFASGTNAAINQWTLWGKFGITF